MEVQLKNLFEKYPEKIRHKSLKCLFTGPPQVGKTTLKKRMLKTIKNIVSSGESSASGGLEKPITFIIGGTSESATIAMGPNYMDWHRQDSVPEEAQTVIQLIQHKTIPKQETQEQISSNQATHIQTVGETCPTNELMPSEIHPIPAPSGETKSASLKKLMLDSLTSRRLPSLKDIEKTTTIYLMDTGGQPEFHEIIPIILQGPALHLVFFNLAFDLNEPVPVQFCHPEVTNPAVTYKSSYTGIQMIYQLLSSLYCLRKDSSRAVLIGTHLDQLKDEEEQGEKRIAEINDSIKQLLTAHLWLLYPCSINSLHPSLYPHFLCNQEGQILL